MNYKKDTTILAFDLHKVLFSYDYLAAFTLLLTQLPLRALCRVAFKPFFWLELYKTSRRTRVLDDIFERVEQKYPQAQALWPFGYALSNTQKPRRHMQELLISLKKEGYVLMLCSNIGPIPLSDLEQKYPDFFSLFDQYLTPQKNTGYIQKPQEAFFAFLKNIAKEKQPEKSHIVLIDDRLSNIAQAQKMGISGILFISLSKLKNSLSKLHQ
jgi:FMN phosphatase YigB (HAD superfamily)